MPLTADQLLALHDTLAGHLAEIASTVFKPGVKLTLICRLPGNDDADVVVTDDDLTAVEAVLFRQRYPHGRCDACGHANRPNGCCSRDGCCNDD